jgi:hypothetical protein
MLRKRLQASIPNRCAFVNFHLLLNELLQLFSEVLERDVVKGVQSPISIMLGIVDERNSHETTHMVFAAKISNMGSELDPFVDLVCLKARIGDQRIEEQGLSPT